MKFPRVILSLVPPVPTFPPVVTVSVSLMPRAFSIFLMILSSGIRLLDSILAMVPCFSWMSSANCFWSIPLLVRASLMAPP